MGRRGGYRGRGWGEGWHGQKYAQRLRIHPNALFSSEKILTPQNPPSVGGIPPANTQPLTSWWVGLLLNLKRCKNDIGYETTK